ncbi:carbohydrate kinase family protein [Devosia epidermidihirudinis]|uniref:carbohydrate kinase family protein n=1 Tax=Devosia epidermidihirudinis TaxID=1293439 RepID=UPI000698CC5C|nr:PfkB family carbohydrate kinase [Devosia epidermidihirudinis]
MSVLVAGEYFCDLILSGLDGVPRLGEEHFADGLSIMPGGTYNMALALSRLGVTSRWANQFGNDLFSQFVLDQARRDGLDERAFEHVDGPVQRLSVAFTGNGERGFLSHSAPRVAPPSTDVLFDRPEWLLQTFRFDSDWLEFIAAARAVNARVLADGRGGEFTLATPGVRAFLAHCDVFSPNAAEALTLAETDDLDVAIARLAPLVPVLLIKNGGDGALLVQGSDVVTVPAPTVAVVDTIGAGDAFNAGLLLGLEQGADWLNAAQLAVLAGSLSTTGTGGRASPMRAALEDFSHIHPSATIGSSLHTLLQGRRRVPHPFKPLEN